MHDVVIVGAGLSGLVCALECHRQGLSVLVLEASDNVGGRIRSDRVDGFTLDRGFQVLLTAYPEAQRYLDYGALDLRRFEPGALVRLQGKFHHVADPRRVLTAAIDSTLAPIGTIADKFRIVLLTSHLLNKSLEEIACSPEATTLSYLQHQGFSAEMIDRFFRPFLGGIYLERKLSTSSRKFEFVFKMFAEGYAAIPAKGMRLIAEQLVSKFPLDRIRFRTSVTKVAADRVILAGGEEIAAQAVVVATDVTTTAKLIGVATRPETVSTMCLYFAAEEAPVDKPILILNGEGHGLVNHVVVMSNISADYAPRGKVLISANTVGIPDHGQKQVERLVHRELEGWFGDQARRWTILKSYVVQNALPSHAPGRENSWIGNHPGLILAGDYLENASSNGAMLSGRKAAEAVAEKLGVPSS